MPNLLLNPIILGLIGLVNLVVLIIYGIDKRKAIKKRWRIPERVLILLAFFGPAGGLLGMLLFRHKIRKPKFFILVPAFLVLQLILFFLIL